MKDNKDILIYEPSVAKDLLLKGKFNIVNIAPDYKDGNRTVFFFEDTIEIREYLVTKWNIYLR